MGRMVVQKTSVSATDRAGADKSDANGEDKPLSHWQIKPAPELKYTRMNDYGSNEEMSVNQIFLALPVDAEDDYRRLSAAERYIWDVSWLITEVNNGGFEQYFFNGTGDHALAALEALKAIGADETSQLLQRACSVFATGFPQSVDQRRLELRRINPNGRIAVLDELDDEFFERTENLYQLLLIKWNEERVAGILTVPIAK
jgi:hypothetical protein